MGEEVHRDEVGVRREAVHRHFTAEEGIRSQLPQGEALLKLRIARLAPDVELPRDGGTKASGVHAEEGLQRLTDGELPLGVGGDLELLNPVGQKRRPGLLEDLRRHEGSVETGEGLSLFLVHDDVRVEGGEFLLHGVLDENGQPVVTGEDGHHVPDGVPRG